ncbi:MAG TPA: GDSL-type esterase/lipase family protein [Geminicoccaceae bacterium]|nr:GDSL-type esterase/lipase family protein [Geminicoccaceae bacterium]
MSRLDRRTFLTLVGASLATTALPAVAAVPTFVALGDSYTASYRNGIPSWADQIDGGGGAKLLANLAVSGSTAEGVNLKKTFDRQVDAWIRDHKPKGVPDRTAVYFGYNDIKADKPLSNAKSQYRAQVDRLVANGVTQGQRRLVLCPLHDWSRNPGATRSYRSRVVEWNRHARSVAAARPNCVVVDLFALFERVFADPDAYEFTNVTESNRALSTTTHLYADVGHFGRKGQALIARAVKPRLL